VISWFFNVCAFTFNLYRYAAAVGHRWAAAAADPSEMDTSVLMARAEPLPWWGPCTR
jgi:hypothetical protein